MSTTPLPDDYSDLCSCGGGPVRFPNCACDDCLCIECEHHNPEHRDYYADATDAPACECESCEVHRAAETQRMNRERVDS